MRRSPTPSRARRRPRAALMAALPLFVGAAAVLAPPSAFAEKAAVIGEPGPPQPSPTGAHLPLSPSAGWSCQGGTCGYVKTTGAWSDCFVAYSPTHGGWLPTRYCR